MGTTWLGWVVLAAALAEAAWLAATGRRALLAAVWPGVAFALAVCAALAEAPWWAVALPLAAAGLLHARDLRQRLAAPVTGA